MATARRTRRQAAAAQAEADGAVATIEPAADDEDEDEDLDEQPAGDSAVSLSHEDFESNPRVIDMASVMAGDNEDAPARARRSEPEPEQFVGRRVRVRLVGLKSAPKARVPYGVSVVVPKDGSYDGVHSEGESVHFIRGRSTAVSARAARWLAKHPEYVVEKV